MCTDRKFAASFHSVQYAVSTRACLFVDSKCGHISVFTYTIRKLNKFASRQKMKSKYTTRKNDEFLKLRSLQKRDRLNLFVLLCFLLLLLLSLFYYDYFLWLFYFFFFLFFISTNWLIQLAEIFPLEPLEVNKFSFLPFII